MFKRNSDVFKNRSSKELYKFFGPNIPKWYIDSLHELMFFAVVGMLAMFGEEEHGLMMEEFQKFLARCEEIVGGKLKRDDQAIKNNPSIDVNTWIGKKSD